MEWRVKLLAAARADEIVRSNDLLTAALVQRHCDAIAIGFDRRRLDAELDGKPPARQMVAQHRLGAPLRLAALELVLAPQARELDERDPLELGPEARSR